jgi:hypothetical protein
MISCLSPRENEMRIINQRIKHWLARLEIKAAATHWADRHAAHHRNTRRAIVEICEAIRERLSLMGLDPALADSLLRGEQEAAELAAIPGSEALRIADAAIHARRSQCRWGSLKHNHGTSRANGSTFGATALTSGQFLLSETRCEKLGQRGMG